MNEPRLNIGQQARVSLGLGQRLLITPQMKISLKLLQMPISELVQEISSCLVENPALETGDFDTEPTEQDSEGEGGESEETAEESFLDMLSKPEWDDYISDGGSVEMSFTPNEEETDYEHTLSSERNLSEHLLFQLKEAGVTREQFIIGSEIVGNLTEEGYFLLSDIPEIAEICECSEEDVEKVLSVIKRFDPAGIASSCAVECMLAQLLDLGISEGEYEQIKELLCSFPEEIAAFKYDEICKKLGLERENFDEIISIISRTDPRPGLSFSNRNTNYAVPDVYIVRSGNGFDVIPNEAGLPAVTVSSYYRKAIKDKFLDAATRDYMEDKIKSALWIINSLKKRQDAIYKVTKAIIDIQKDYLIGGEAYFKPLKLKDIAEITSLNESTVSRVTSGKYVMTDKGLLELKSFFSKGMDSAEGNTSTRKIKLRIKEAVEGEPPGTPLSDDKLVKKMAEEGITIARRTVTKYREELGIPTMAQRKRIKKF